MNRLKLSLHKKDPFSTPAGKLVEQITNVADLEESATLDALDPAVAELCEQLSASDDGPKNAMKAIRDRLLHSAGKNQQQFIRTLTLLDILVSNCGSRLHAHVASHKFLDDLKTILSSKYAIGDSNRRRVCSLLDAWSTAFRGQQQLIAVEQFFNSLTRGGGSPHESAQSSRRQSGPRSLNVSRSHGHAHYQRISQRSPTARSPSVPYRATPESIRRLEQDLDVIVNNLVVFHDILTVADNPHLPKYGDVMSSNNSPSDSHSQSETASQPDWISAHAIVMQCREMQNRLHKLISAVNGPSPFGGQLPEALLARVLEINDDLTNMFHRASNYHVEMRARDQRAGCSSSSSPPGYASVAAHSGSRARSRAFDSEFDESDRNALFADLEDAFASPLPSDMQDAGTPSRSSNLRFPEPTSHSRSNSQKSRSHNSHSHNSHSHNSHSHNSHSHSHSSHSHNSHSHATKQASAPPQTTWSTRDESGSTDPEMTIPTIASAPVNEFEQLSLTTRPKSSAATSPSRSVHFEQPPGASAGGNQSELPDDLISL